MAFLLIPGCQINLSIKKEHIAKRLCALTRSWLLQEEVHELLTGLREEQEGLRSLLRVSQGLLQVELPDHSSTSFHEG